MCNIFWLKKLKLIIFLYLILSELVSSILTPEVPIKINENFKKLLSMGEQIFSALIIIRSADEKDLLKMVR